MLKLNEKPLLEVANLKVYFPIKKGLMGKTVDYIRAVDDVSFRIQRGMTMGLVGESGSGKTTIGRAIVRLVETFAGVIRYEYTDITYFNRTEMLPFRKKIQMIFQDPYHSLNPRMTIFHILSEPMGIHFPKMTNDECKARALELLKMVGLEEKHLNRYPHEFSGGQRQRIGIARALAVKPEFIICDEPVSALDVSVQAQIVNLLKDLQQQLGLTYLFIAHDLAVVQHMSDEVLVMHHGKIVEHASAEEIYENPKHEYTKKLIAAVPSF
jgi:oligopeptide transport system ATP-binding protein